MNAFERLNFWMAAIERRLRWATWARGGAITVAMALVATVLLVYISSLFAFSNSSLVVSRFLLFFGARPGRRFRRGLAAAALEPPPAPRPGPRLASPNSSSACSPLVEREDKNDPFLELLARRCREHRGTGAPGRGHARRHFRLPWPRLPRPCLGTLIWLVAAGPGFMGYGSALLWAGIPPGSAESFFRIQVMPGDAKVRRGSDQMVNAHLIGFQAQTGASVRPIQERLALGRSEDAAAGGRRQRAPVPVCRSRRAG